MRELVDICIIAITAELAFIIGLLLAGIANG
jgi:hypothetical protein